MQTLLDTYALFASGKLSEEDAATAFGLTLKDFRYRISRYGARLPSVLAVLDQIKVNKITREKAAEQLGVTVRTVNHISNTWGVQRDVRQYIVKRTAAEVKRELRKAAAINYIAGTTQIEDAAESAQVSTRQMRRWVSELLQEHFGMVWKDLKDLPLNRRTRLAQEIRKAESLAGRTEQVVHEIMGGKKTIADEVVTRISERRQLRRI